MKYQANFDSDPAFKGHQQYRDEVGGGIYRSAYNMRSEFEAVLDFKAFLDSYDNQHGSAFHHDLDILHMHLTDLSESILRLEQRCIFVAEDDLHFLPTSSEFSNRHTRQTIAEKQAHFMHQADPEHFPAPTPQHPELKTTVTLRNDRSPDEIALGYLNYILSGAGALRDAVEQVVVALEKDAENIKRGLGKQPFTPETSRVAQVLLDAQTILDPQHLPTIMLHAQIARNALAQELEQHAHSEAPSGNQPRPGTSSDTNFSI